MANFLLNISLIFSMLLAPVILASAIWYRRSLGKPTFVWNLPEMVVVTIVFFVASLLLVIVGVSCFFSQWGYLDSLHIQAGFRDQYFTLGVSCILFLAGFGLLYLAMRKLMVQVVMDKGILLNEKLFPLPGSLKMVQWNEICDYYIVPDYPNAICNFIVKTSDLSYDRYAIKVPIFLKEDFIAFLEKQIYSVNTLRTDDSRKSSQRFFSEN